MSYFILQSTKVIKITDGSTTLTVLGYAGRDNNLYPQGSAKTVVEFFRCFATEQEIQCLRRETASAVLSGNLQLRDMSRASLAQQATAVVSRLDQRLKNAPTYQVARCTALAPIDWGDAQSRISSDMGVSCRFKKALTYTPLEPARMMPGDRQAADFVKAPRGDPESILPILGTIPYALAYLDPAARLNEQQFVDLLAQASDWGAPLDLDQYKGTVRSASDALRLAHAEYFGYSNLHQLPQVLDPQLLRDRALGQQLVSIKPWVYRYLPGELIQDEAVARQAVQAQSANYQYAPEGVRMDKTLTVHCLKERAQDLMPFVPEPLVHDPQVVQVALTRSGTTLQYVAAPFKDDRELVTVAVKDAPAAYQYASERLRADPTVLLHALRPHYQQEVLEHAPQALRTQVEQLVRSASSPTILDAVQRLVAQQQAQQEAHTLDQAIGHPQTHGTVKKKAPLGRAL